MIILSNDLLEEDGGATVNNQGKIVRTYNQKRLVESTFGNSKQCGDALNYTLGQAFSNDANALLTGIKITRKFTKDRYFWDIAIDFSTEGTPTFENSVDPTKQRVKRHWGTTEQTIYITRDRGGTLIVNAANQPFDGGIPVTMELPTLTYEYNQPNFNGAQAAEWSNSLNQYSFSGAPPKTLKMKVTAEETFEGIYAFWKTRVDMAYFPLTWVPRPINAGLYQLISGKLVRCKDRDRLDATSPMPLALDGTQIPQASLPDAANTIDVDWFTLMDYSTTGLLPT